MKYFRLFSHKLVDAPKSLSDFGGEPMGNGYLPVPVEVRMDYLTGTFTASGDWPTVNWVVLVDNHLMVTFKPLTCPRTILNKESLSVMFRKGENGYV